MDHRHELRIMVRGIYDLQKLRIQMGNRIVMNFLAKLGQAPGEKGDTLEAENKHVLDMLKERYKKLTDGVMDLPAMKDFDGDEVISSYAELAMLAHYLMMEKQERRGFREIGLLLDEIPIYGHFLKGVKGIGPAMAGVLISEIDIREARHPSSLWKYAGLDVAGDGRGRSKRKEHLVRVKYKDKDGKEQERDSITFNPFLRTKLLGVLAASFLRAGSPYAAAYQDYKHRMEHHQTYGEGKPGHRHRMALRYMIKMFLVDLYASWRELEGLPVSKPYHEAKLGHGEARLVKSA